MHSLPPGRWGLCSTSVEAVGGEFAQLVEAGALPHDVALALMRELSARKPTVLVLEDVQWADGATLDVLRVVGRRVKQLPSLVLASYRDTELGPFHPLRMVLGELASGRASARIRLEPLSSSAVARLAEPYAMDPVELHATDRRESVLRHRGARGRGRAHPADRAGRGARPGRPGRSAGVDAARAGRCGSSSSRTEAAGDASPATRSERSTSASRRACSSRTQEASRSGTSSHG